MSGLPDEGSRRTPPDLNDPVQREAYRRELTGVARGIRMGGIAIMLAGAGLGLLRRFVWPELPIWVVATVIGWGVLVCLTGIAARTRYHQLRMRQ